MIEIKLIDETRKNDINIPNEPFSLSGKMIPIYDGQQWDYTVTKNGTISEMCFPDENYDYDKMSDNSVFIGAYDGEKCIGLAIMQKAFFKYMYLMDLKVNKEYRRRGTAKKLIEAAEKVAAGNGYRGIYTTGQDNNIGACLFYIKCGFRIGGIDTEVYNGTKQEGKTDIVFYLDS